MVTMGFVVKDRFNRRLVGRQRVSGTTGGYKASVSDARVHYVPCIKLGLKTMGRTCFRKY